MRLIVWLDPKNAGRSIALIVKHANIPENETGTKETKTTMHPMSLLGCGPAIQNTTKQAIKSINTASEKQKDPSNRNPIN